MLAKIAVSSEGANEEKSFKCNHMVTGTIQPFADYVLRASVLAGSWLGTFPQFLTVYGSP